MSAGLNMRMGPGTNYPIIRALPNGTVLLVLGPGFLRRLAVRADDGSAAWLGSPQLYGLHRPRTDYQCAADAHRTADYADANTDRLADLCATANRQLVGRVLLPTLSSPVSRSVVRQDAAVNFNWGYGSPAPGIPGRQLLGALDEFRLV